MASRLIPAIEEPTMSRLQNKVAVITGATSGIGLAAAQRFVAEGAFVYIFARRHEELNKTVASIGRNIVACKATSAILRTWTGSVPEVALHTGARASAR
jgi:NAD(P)-dependent dehydrogenase (short-subunit alcohol dehydrogenase family)